MSVKIFPHNDAPARSYFQNAPLENKNRLEPYLTVYSGQGIQNGTKLRKLVESFANLTGGVNYNDEDLSTLLKRVNIKHDPDIFVVILYGIHTSNGDITPHVTVQMGDGSTDELKKICHFYVKWTVNGYVWDSSIPPTWETSATKWRVKGADQKFG